MRHFMIGSYENTAEKSKTVCFSGHRPEKLPDGGNGNSRVIKVLKSILYKSVLDSIQEGYNCFITGLARGVDLWAGEIILELKAQGENVKLVAAVPYKGHGKGFLNDEKYIFGNIMLKADEKVYLSDHYTKGCMQRRNEYMVNRSGKLIAVVSDYSSGTGYTIRYARQQGIVTRIIDPVKLERQIAAAGNAYNIDYNDVIT